MCILSQDSFKAALGANLFTPSSQMLDAMHCLMAAMALHNTIEPIVLSYETAILASRKWRMSEDFAEAFAEAVVSTRGDLDLLSKEDRSEFEQLRRAACKESGLFVEKPEFCPLLTASLRVTQYEKKLINVMAPLTGMAYSDISWDMGLRERVIKLTRALLMPFTDKERILQLAEEMACGVYPLLDESELLG